MTKKVKITVTGLPITTISSPLTMGTHGPVVLDTKDIFKCIVAGAKVVEVFDGYGEVVLTLSNYNSDNTPYIKAAVVKATIDEMEDSEDDVQEQQSVSEEPVITEEDSVSAEDSTDDTSEEVVTEESQVEEPKSPEHWMPPQRDNNQAKNNNRNNSNKGKRK